MIPLEIFGHLAFLLIAFSFTVKDMLWLRGLSISSSICSIIFNYNVPAKPLWTIIGWCCVFICLNFYHIGKIFYGKKDLHMTDKEEELYNTLFSDMSKVEFLKLSRLAHWENLDKGTTIVMQGKKMDRLMLIYSGCTSVSIDGNAIATLKDGSFIGEMSFLTKRPATADVYTVEDTEVLTWKQDELRALISRNPSLLFSLQAAIGLQLSNAITGQTNKAVA